MKVVQPVPIGTKVKVQIPYGKGEEREERECTVVEIYEHFVVVEDKYGIRRGITNADLMLMGLVQQKL